MCVCVCVCVCVCMGGGGDVGFLINFVAYCMGLWAVFTALFE